MYLFHFWVRPSSLDDGSCLSCHDLRPKTNMGCKCQVKYTPTNSPPFTFKPPRTTQTRGIFDHSSGMSKQSETPQCMYEDPPRGPSRPWNIFTREEISPCSIRTSQSIGKRSHDHDSKKSVFLSDKILSNVGHFAEVSESNPQLGWLSNSVILFHELHTVPGVLTYILYIKQRMHLVYLTPLKLKTTKTSIRRRSLKIHLSTSFQPIAVCMTESANWPVIGWIQASKRF